MESPILSPNQNTVPSAPIPAHVYIIMWARSPSETGNRTHGRPVLVMPTFAKAKYWLDYECQMIKHSTSPVDREAEVVSDPVTQIAELKHRMKVPKVGRAPEAHMVFVNYYWIEMMKVQPDDGEERIGSWRK
jgi:hypothetical protein